MPNKTFIYNTHWKSAYIAYNLCGIFHLKKPICLKASYIISNFNVSLGWLISQTAIHMYMYLLWLHYKIYTYSIFVRQDNLCTYPVSSSYIHRWHQPVFSLNPLFIPHIHPPVNFWKYYILFCKRTLCAYTWCSWYQFWFIYQCECAILLLA